LDAILAPIKRKNARIGWHSSTTTHRARTHITHHFRKFLSPVHFHYLHVTCFHAPYITVKTIRDPGCSVHVALSLPLPFFIVPVYIPPPARSSLSPLSHSLTARGTSRHVMGHCALYGTHTCILCLNPLLFTLGPPSHHTRLPSFEIEKHALRLGASAHYVPTNLPPENGFPLNNV
jgi:hypothetical protein